MKLKDVLIVCTEPTNKTQSSTIQLVQKTLKKYKINYEISVREKLNSDLFKNKDLIVVIGGDGTFLIASHYIRDKTLFFGVNSDPEYKEGFFMSATKADFEQKFKKILKSKFKIRKLHRLEAYIGSKKIPELALNEFYVAAAVPYHTARYYFSARGKRERQKSSGILVSTAAGSYAWMKSAGGKTLPLDSDRFQYLIREPYCGRTAAKCTLINDVLNKNEKVSIEFENADGLIIADSTGKEHRFKAKEMVVIKLSKNPLYSVSF